MSRPSPNDLYHTCQELIAAGQPVFPCKSSGDRAKAPLGSLVPNGVKDATLDRDKVKRWWRAQGTAAIGIATGYLWDVLDVDIKPEQNVDGRRHLTRLNHLGLLNGCQRVVRTPSGGWHLYFKATPGMTNKARGATLGLDVRAAGGYVIAAGSYIETPKYAGMYEDHGLTVGATDAPLYWDLIANELAPVNTDTAETIKLLPSERQSSVAALREFVAHLLPGERNNGFFWAVNRCIENGIDPDELVEPASLIGLDGDEVMKSIDSALKRAGVRAEELSSEADALFPDAVA